jgi:hypothetical protein
MVGFSFSLKRVAWVAGALALYLSTTGCGSISVNDNPPSSSNPPPSQLSNSITTRPRHDLAVIGVDFDPALDVERLSRHEPVNLLVGISNQGSASESAVRITADLWSGDGSTRLLHTERTLESLAAGNVTAVRLVNTEAPPFYTRYRLTVKIEPVNGESNTANNTRSLDITVNTSR